MVTLEIQGIIINAGNWVGPRNLKSHRVAEIFATGNVKTDCGKRFGPGSVVPENGTESHVMRCADCVKLSKSEPLPTLEISRESGDSVGTGSALVAAESADAGKGIDDFVDVGKSAAPRILVRSAINSPNPCEPLVIGVSATGHYVQNQSDKADYLSLCGRQIDVSKSGQRDKLCKRCEKFITYDELVTETERLAAEGGSERGTAIERENAPEIVESVTDAASPESNSVERKSSAKAGNSETTEQRAHREALAAAREAKEFKRAKALAAPDFVKCAVKGTHKLSPVDGTDADGINGRCPECSTFAPLTSNGYIGTHNVGNAPTPPAQTLSERTVPPVATDKTHGAPADAEKAVAKRVDTIRKGEAEMPTASVAPTGHGAAPMLDGVATLPRGKMGTAGVRFDDEVTDTATVGGRYGWLTSDEYEAMKKGPHGRSRTRNYWRGVKKNREHAKALSKGKGKFAGKRGNGGRAH